MGYMSKLAAMGAAAVPPAGAAAAEPEPAVPAEAPAAAISLDAGAPRQDDTDETAKRRAHEAAEAKRKAEWEAKQAEKKAARQTQLDRIAAMGSAELLAASVKRVAADTEKLTRRNMKEAVAEHIQTRCREDASFARLVMDPAKSMVHCFQYINRQARAYAEQEMKDNGIERAGVYGLDVPDGLCYQWAVDYFNDPDAQEDHEGEEKFVPHPYVGKSKPAKPKEPKKPAKTEAKSKAGVSGQMSLL